MTNNFFLSLLIFIVLGCIPTQSQTYYYQDDIENTILESMENRGSNIEDLVDYAKEYLGSPYQLSGETPAGFDCSGFVRYVFEQFGISLPHSSKAMSTYGSEVTVGNLQIGDLVFFEGHSRNRIVGHVGIICDINEMGVYFIHASTNSNVTISSIKEAYYSSRFLKAKRISIVKI